MNLDQGVITSPDDSGWQQVENVKICPPEGRCYLIKLTNVKQNSNHPSQTIHLHLPSIQSVLIMVHFCAVIKMISVEFGLCVSSLS